MPLIALFSRTGTHVESMYDDFSLAVGGDANDWQKAYLPLAGCK
jgi:hypothetical protein